MYEKLYSVKWEGYTQELALRTEVTKMFNIIMPDLKPNNIKSVIKFIQDDKSVVSLRKMLSNTIGKGEEESKWLNINQYYWVRNHAEDKSVFDVSMEQYLNKLEQEKDVERVIISMLKYKNDFSAGVKQSVRHV